MGRLAAVLTKPGVFAPQRWNLLTVIVVNQIFRSSRTQCHAGHLTKAYAYAQDVPAPREDYGQNRA